MLLSVRRGPSVEAVEGRMRSRCCIGIVASLVLVAVAAGPALAVDMGIVTGGEKGTYYQFGLNLQRLGKPHRGKLKVATSRGSGGEGFARYPRPHTPARGVRAHRAAVVGHAGGASRRAR